MIDEKKIEEAVNELYNSNAIFRRYDQAEIGFKAGINWFLNNLWHGASEEPEEGERLLVERIFTGEKSYAEDTKKSLYNSWQTKVNREKITRWLYIEDLMKGGKQ